MLEYSGMYQNIPKYSRIFRNIQKNIIKRYYTCMCEESSYNFYLCMCCYGEELLQRDCICQFIDIQCMETKVYTCNMRYIRIAHYYYYYYSRAVVREAAGGDRPAHQPLLRAAGGGAAARLPGQPPGPEGCPQGSPDQHGAQDAAQGVGPGHLSHLNRLLRLQKNGERIYRYWPGWSENIIIYGTAKRVIFSPSDYFFLKHTTLTEGK